VTAGSEDTVDNIVASTTPTVRTWTVASVPQVTLASNQHILVRFYLKKITESNARLSNSAATGSVYLGVNGTGTALGAMRRGDVDRQSRNHEAAGGDACCESSLILMKASSRTRETVRHETVNLKL